MTAKTKFRLKRRSRDACLKFDIHSPPVVDEVPHDARVEKVALHSHNLRTFSARSLNRAFSNSR